MASPGNIPTKMNVSVIVGQVSSQFLLQACVNTNNNFDSAIKSLDSSFKVSLHALVAALIFRAVRIINYMF